MCECVRREVAKKCCWLFDEKIMWRASKRRAEDKNILRCSELFWRAGGTRLNISQILFYVS